MSKKLSKELKQKTELVAIMTNELPELGIIYHTDILWQLVDKPLFKRYFGERNTKNFRNLLSNRVFYELASRRVEAAVYLYYEHRENRPMSDFFKNRTYKSKEGIRYSRKQLASTTVMTPKVRWFFDDNQIDELVKKYPVDKL